MDHYSIWVFVHVLLFVFWLGTDVGVFLAGKYSERGDLSMETRSTVLRLGMVLDRMPRSALTLIMPSGLQLAAGLGLLTLPGLTLPLIWGLGLGWLALLWAGFLNPETALEKRAMMINFILNILAAVIVLGFTLYLAMGTATPTWLIVKVGATGLIFVTGVLLDVLFRPAVVAFMTLVGEGATPERDQAFSRAMSPVYRAVLVIYALVLLSAFVGIAKPF